MKPCKIISNLFLLIALFLCLCCCEREKQHLNIVLYNKPLSVIQSYTSGRWNLEYSFGGLWAHKIIDKYNSYIVLFPDHIIISNDSLGSELNTSITWVKTDIGTNVTTFLLRYSFPEDPLPNNYVIQQIKNDTLVIYDYLDDGFSYYYTR